MGHNAELPLIGRIDDEILDDFLTRFPEFKDPESLRVLNEEKMKSTKGKETWRGFIMPVRPRVRVFDGAERQYEKRVTDYNFGTLVRKFSDREYDQDNSILVTRVQFFAIEVSDDRLR